MIAQNGNIGFYKFNTNEFVNIDECIILKEKLFCKIKNFVNHSNITGNIYAIESNNDKTLSFADIIKQNKNIDTSYFDGITIKQKKKTKIYGIDKTNYNTYFGEVPLSHKSFFQSNHYLLDEFQKSAVKYFNEYEMNFTENISKLKQMTYFISNNVIKEYGIIEKELAHNFEDLAVSISKINE